MSTPDDDWRRAQLRAAATPAAKLCAGCQTRPRRYACLRCGDALCRRCVAARACCGNVERAPAPTLTERALTAADVVCGPREWDIGGISSVMRGDDLATLPQTSSAVPPPASRAAETPSTSTTPLLPEDAGGGGASTGRGAYGPRPGSLVDTAMRLAAQGPFTARQLASATRQPIASVRTQLGKLRRAGGLVYSGRPSTPRSGDCGTYSLPGAVVEQPAAPARVPPPLRREPSASAVTTAASAMALHVRPRGPVAGQHARPADFYADKPVLPSARPPVVPERGARHAR
jgi:hypothetical protein